ncbi:MAG: glucokinase [Rhodobacteraceae bacterium]|nr:glucokinase [Paracoccaceae bacterium]
MTILVADVGGTNSRLALVSDNKITASASSKFSNGEYGSFYEIVAEFLTQKNTQRVSACCVAMAGPVFAGRGKLTNLDWVISEDDLQAATGSGGAMVINDLTALGYSVGHLPQDGLTPVCPSDTDGHENGQSLIVGMGTGFNVCPLKTTVAGVTTCFEAEGGHIGLSKAVLELLSSAIGGQSAKFGTVEELFSGRGLARFHQCLVQDEALEGSQIVHMHENGKNEAATRTLQIYASLLGAHCRELALQYLPLNGIYFAGSVARGVLGTGLTAEFVAELNQHRRFKRLFSQMPVSIIKDDAAALVGCVAACRSALV